MSFRSVVTASKFLWVGFFLISLFSVHFSIAIAETAEEEKLFSICRNSKEKVVRTLKVSIQNSECKTVYNRAGQDRVVGQGRNLQSCLKIAENIQENLTKAGWQCRNVAVDNYSESVSSELQPSN